jgi:hypothetical protein
MGPLIAQVIDCGPREFGYHSTEWTAPLLLVYLSQIHGIDVSRKGVSLAIDRIEIGY